MMYDIALKTTILDVLQDRTSRIADVIQMLFSEGYNPNKNKITILNWSSILIDAYENVDLLSEEQQCKLDNLYNKVLKL